MSSLRFGRITRQLVLTLGMIGSVSGVGAAQSAAAAREELDRLLPEWRAANAAVAAEERARQRTAGAVIVDRGHLRIVADSAIATLVAEAAALASASLDRVFGADARFVDAHSVVAQLQSVARNSTPTRVIRVRRSASDLRAPAAADTRRLPNEERVVAIGTDDETRAGLTRALEAVAAAPLHSTLDDQLRLWFRTALPATPESGEELADIYVDLTTASTDVSRRCLTGDLVGCRQTLGLAPVADPVLEGYTATQRRSLVEGSADRLRTSARAAEFDRCVVGLDDAACVSRLRDLSEERLWQAYSTTAVRRSFARWAIARGGPDAYSKLRSAPAMPLDERFAAAARMPADSLVASWRAHVMGARPARPSIPPVTAITTLLWIAACGALALRSSKWR